MFSIEQGLVSIPETQKIMEIMASRGVKSGKRSQIGVEYLVLTEINKHEGKERGRMTSCLRLTALVRLLGRREWRSGLDN